jgi:hypothetical protein
MSIGAALTGILQGVASAQPAPTQGQLISPANPITPSSAFDAANSYAQPNTYRGAVRLNELASPTRHEPPPLPGR